MGVLEGQVAIVTGGGLGIGRGIAQELGQAGAHVVVVSRRAENLAETVRLIREAGGAASARVADVTVPEQVEALVAETVANHGKLDLLVNNAGRFFAIAPVWESDPQNWWQDVTVNLYGTYLCCRAAARRMIEQRAGKIINLGGGGSMAAFTYASGYGTSKAALVRFSETLHEEIKEYGVSVYAISPGLVRTEMTQFQLDSPEGQKWLPRIGQSFAEGRDVPPTEAGKLCVFLASPAGDGLGGRFIQVRDDYRQIAQRAPEVVERDLYVLRRPGLSA
ncbi:MAG TPA: SDR family oxidoreductase [Chloroflexota bacterium]|nr:SDR family oxidoreductase [Chloroflexota bacterium]